MADGEQPTPATIPIVQPVHVVRGLHESHEMHDQPGDTVAIDYPKTKGQNEMKITKVLQLKDEARGAWFDVYEAPGIKDDLVTVEVCRDAAEPRQVHRELMKHGAALPVLKLCEDELKHAIAAEAPISCRAGHNGWRRDDDGNDQFVSFNHVAGCGEEQVIEPPMHAMGSVEQIGTYGSLKKWRALITVAEYSTVMMVALCAAFAAPLMALLNRPSFGLVFFGDSRGGKSTAQVVGASALGFGREEDMPTLDATHAGLLAAGLAFNGHMLPLNEAGSAAGSKAEVAEAVRKATYSLMGGRDVLRHPSWGGSGAQNSFKVLPIISSEFSPDDWAARSGEERDPGETVRLIGLPVGRGVFDFYPESVSKLDEAPWMSGQYSTLRNELPRQRGVAFRLYTEELTADSAGARDRANEYLDQFERKLVEPGMTPITRDIVAKFGLLTAGGCLAVDWDILPFDKPMVKEAMELACRRAIASLPDGDADLRRYLAKVRAFLAGPTLLDADNMSDRRRELLDNADGYSRARERGREYVARAKALVDLLKTDLAMRRTLLWFDEEGYLDHTRAQTNGRGMLWAKKQVTWPNGTRPHSFVFFFPSGLSDLDRML